MEKNLWLKDRYYNLLVLSQNQLNQLTDSEEGELLSYQIILSNQIYYSLLPIKIPEPVLITLPFVFITCISSSK